MLRLKIHHGLAAGALVALMATSGIAQDMMFGGEDDLSYAATLWEALESNKLAGDGAIHALPYEGGAPHGAFLETLNATIEVEGLSGKVVVKRNYGPAEGGAGEVWNDPAAYLGAVTVMFQREGYDPDNNDWFWAKFLPDGSLDMTPDGVEMAGQVGGCISCHSGALDADYMFVND